MDILHFLDAVQPLSTDLRGHLASILKTRTIRKGDYLLTAGAVSKEVCFVQRGLLRCYHMKGDKEVSRWFMKEGDVIFSILSFYNQIVTDEYIQALENTSVSYITYSELQEVYRRFPEFERVGRLLTEKYYQLWDVQLSSILLHSASERYQWLCQFHPELVLRVPSKHLASFLGISELTLYKIRSRASFKPVRGLPSRSTDEWDND